MQPWVPEPRPWPELSRELLAVLDGARLERPFTTEQCNEFPTRGYYACVRCRTPIAAAVNKLGVEGGMSAFQRLNVSDTEIRVVSGEYTTRLQVSCKKCKGNLGEISQDIPMRVKCETGELFKANSVCLHFVDGPAASVLHGNFCAADDDRDGALDEHFIDDVMLLAPDSSSGPRRQVPVTQQLTNSRNVNSIATAVAVSTAAPSRMVNMAGGAPTVVSAQDRHHGTGAALNEYSDEDTPREKGPGEPNSSDYDDE